MKRALSLVVAVVIVVCLSSCGGSQTSSSPEIRQDLQQIDAALAQQHFVQAREQLQSLVDATVKARDAGNLESQQAADILAAASHLTTAIRVERSSQIPAATPTPTSQDEGAGGGAGEGDQGDSPGQSTEKGNKDHGKGPQGEAKGQSKD
jgi:hypothetical protein